MARDKYGRVIDTGFVYAYLKVGEILPVEVSYWHGGHGLPEDDGEPGYKQTKADPGNGWGPDAGRSYYAEWHVEGVSIKMTADVRISVPRELYSRMRMDAENEFGVVSL